MSFENELEAGETDFTHSEELGPVIVEFRELNNIVAAVSGAVAVAIYSLVMWHFQMDIGRIMLVAGSVMSALVVCGLVSLVPHVNDVFRFREEGFEVVRYNDYWSARVEDLIGFTVGKTHVYQNGCYTGSTAKMVFETDRESKKFSLSYRKCTSKEEGMDAFSDIASHAVATRMLQTIQQGGEVHWTGRATLAQNGLRIESRSGAVEEIPYAAIADYQVHQGMFQLRRNGKRVMKCGVDSPNFLPGLRLMEWLTSQVKAGGSVNTMSVAAQSPASSLPEPVGQPAVVPQPPQMLDGYSLLANQ